MKKIFKIFFGTVVVLGVAAGAFFAWHEYAVYETQPQAVRLANALLEDIVSPAPQGGARFFAADSADESADAALRARLRERMLPFWGLPGQVEISAGSVFTANHYKRALSEEPYRVRVVCIKRADDREQTLVLHYRPAEGAFAPYADLEGARVRP